VGEVRYKGGVALMGFLGGGEGDKGVRIVQLS